MSAKIPSIGIDLGTSNCRVGIWKKDRVEFIVDASYVAFTKDERLIGQSAKAAGKPNSSIFDIKRLLGRRVDDLPVQNYWPFQIVPGSDDKVTISVSYMGKVTQLLVEEIAAMVLRKLKELTEAYLGYGIQDIVLSVPANYSDSQREAILEAAAIAGLKVLRLIHDSSAVAFVYAEQKKEAATVEKKKVMIIDLGGGHLDVSLVHVDDGVLQVKSIAGETLGGEDFVDRMVQHFSMEFKRKHGEEISGNVLALGKLRYASEIAKESLSVAQEATVEVKSLVEDIDFHSTISRSKFEEINMDLFIKCRDVVEDCLSNAQISKCSVSDVVLAGGSTRIPIIQQLISDYFNGKVLCTTLNPGAVAYGASMQAAILTGEGSEILKDYLLFDVTPLSLQLVAAQDRLKMLIPKNTAIPNETKKVLSEYMPNLDGININVYGGDSSEKRACSFVASIQILGIPAVPKPISVFFQIDRNGILKAFAELNPGEKLQVNIEKGRLSTDEKVAIKKRGERYYVTRIHKVYSVMQGTKKAGIEGILDEALLLMKSNLQIPTESEAFRNFIRDICELITRDSEEPLSKLKSDVASLFALINYIDLTRNRINDEDMASQLAEYKKLYPQTPMIEDVLNEASDWLHALDGAEAHELDLKFKEVTGIVDPIMAACELAIDDDSLV